MYFFFRFLRIESNLILDVDARKHVEWMIMRFLRFVAVIIYR